MFTILSVIILIILILALLTNYIMCGAFYDCWKNTARVNWLVMGKPKFNEFYWNQLGLFRPVILGSQLDNISSNDLLKKRSHVRWTWLMVLAMLFAGCALVGFEADLRPAKSAIIPIENIKF